MTNLPAQNKLAEQIGSLWEDRNNLQPGDVFADGAIHEAISLLDQGVERVAEFDTEGNVVINEWLKLAILLLFRQSEMVTTEVGPFEFVDKIPLKTNYQERGVRVVPGASA